MLWFAPAQETCICPNSTDRMHAWSQKLSGVLPLPLAGVVTVMHCYAGETLLLVPSFCASSMSVLTACWSHGMRRRRSAPWQQQGGTRSRFHHGTVVRGRRTQRSAKGCRYMMRKAHASLAIHGCLACCEEGTRSYLPSKTGDLAGRATSLHRKPSLPCSARATMSLLVQ